MRRHEVRFESNILFNNNKCREITTNCVLSLFCMTASSDILQSENVSSSLRSLRSALDLRHRHVISEALSHCLSLNIDPDNSLIVRAQAMVKLSEAGFSLERMVGAMNSANLKGFDVELQSIRTSPNTTPTDRSDLASLLLEQSNRNFRAAVQRGGLIEEEVRLLRQALSTVRAMRVETAPMQITRLLIEGVTARQGERARNSRRKMNSKRQKGEGGGDVSVGGSTGG